MKKTNLNQMIGALALLQTLSLAGCSQNQGRFYDIVEIDGELYVVEDYYLTTMKTITQTEDGLKTKYGCPVGTTDSIGSGADLVCKRRVYNKIPDEEIIDYNNGCLVLKDTCYKTNEDGTIQEYECSKIRCK